MSEFFEMMQAVQNVAAQGMRAGQEMERAKMDAALAHWRNIVRPQLVSRAVPVRVDMRDIARMDELLGAYTTQAREPLP